MKLLQAMGLAAAVTLGGTQAVNATTMFTADLTEAQEVAAPMPLGASGMATLVLNAAMTRLEMTIQLVGLDLDGLQTATVDDNVTAMHIHAAPVGVNGGVVFGLLGLMSDLNGDLMTDPVTGLVSSAWDLGEGNGTDLNLQLGNLFSEGLYFNVHTMASPGGQIRGQIVGVPEPTGLAMLAGATVIVGFAVRRRG